MSSPKLAVDVIVEVEENLILLIERKFPPMGWALPGGFVEEGENIEKAALRELQEETNLKAELLDLFYVYSHPKRDARGHTVSVVFIAKAQGKPEAGDDAQKAQFFPVENLPSPLCFDHAEILADFLNYRKTGKRVNPQEKFLFYEK